MVNICVETVDRESLTVVTPLTMPYKDTVDNLILLKEFNVSNKIQQICYERIKLMAIRTMVNKSITFRQLNLHIVTIIWQLKIQNLGKGVEEEVDARAVARDAPASDTLTFQTLDKLLS